MDAREKLSQLAAERGSSLAALSRMIGRNASYLQQYIGKGSPKKLEDEDRRVLAGFFGVAESELGGSQDISYDSQREWVEVPRLTVDASAGPGAASAQEIAFDAFRFSRKWLREQGLEPGQLSAIRVVGDSMEPLLREGDDLLVDTARRPFRDGVYVVRLDDTLLVKRVTSRGGGQLSLLSQNMAYPPVTVSSEDCTIVGRVVWKSGRL